jgi:hypothetical protein
LVISSRSESLSIIAIDRQVLTRQFEVILIHRMSQGARQDQKRPRMLSKPLDNANL